MLPSPSPPPLDSEQEMSAAATAAAAASTVSISKRPAKKSAVEVKAEIHYAPGNKVITVVKHPSEGKELVSRKRLRLSSNSNGAVAAAAAAAAAPSTEESADTQPCDEQTQLAVDQKDHWGSAPNDPSFFTMSALFAEMSKSYPATEKTLGGVRALVNPRLTTRFAMQFVSLPERLEIMFESKDEKVIDGGDYLKVFAAFKFWGVWKGPKTTLVRDKHNVYSRAVHFEHCSNFQTETLLGPTNARYLYQPYVIIWSRDTFKDIAMPSRISATFVGNADHYGNVCSLLHAMGYSLTGRKTQVETQASSQKDEYTVAFDWTPIPPQPPPVEAAAAAAAASASSNSAPASPSNS